MYEFHACRRRIGDTDRAGHEHVDPSAHAQQFDRHRDSVSDAADDLAAVLSPERTADANQDKDT